MPFASRREQLAYWKRYNAERREKVERCPLLGIKLIYRPARLGAPNAASIDRIVNRKGYTKGNVQIISQKANLMKGNRSLKDFMARIGR